jgi:competence protein ComEC
MLAADAVIIPFLKHQNIAHPDLLVVSHGDRDHIGGSKALLTKYPGLRVLTSVEEEIFHSNVDKCVAGQRWQWDGVDFEILSPSHPEDYQGNNSSCVLKVSNDQHSILLAGDIEQATESRLTRTLIDKLSAKLLIVPHHGSKTSSYLNFIDKVSPEIAVFPVGYRNRFGFPKQDIISRYESRQVKILNTARDGALLFRFDDQQMIFNRYRHDNQRFWTSEY